MGRPVETRRRVLGAALLTGLTGVAYGSVLTNPGAYEFLNVDDQRYIVENPRVTAGLTGENVAWAFTSLRQSNWHPLTWISWQLDAWIYGVSAGGFHLTNLALHVVSTVALFLFLERVTRAWGPSLVVAGLFAIHPLHVESVAWVSERKDLLSTVFFLLMLHAYVAYARRPSPARYGVVLTLFAASLMSKSMLVTVPFLLLVLDVWPLERVAGYVLPGGGRAREVGVATRSLLVVEKLPLLVLAALCAAVTLRAQDRMMEALRPLPFLARVENALVHYATYIGRTFWPTELVVYRKNAGVAPDPLRLMGSVALLAVPSVLAWRSRHRRPYLLAGWLWYLGTLVPVIGLVQVGYLATADHYTYVPLIGVFIMVAWAGADALAAMRAPSVPSWASALVLAACLVVTRRQVGFWKNSATLWEHVVASSPRDAVAHAFLGRGLEAQGRRAEADAQFLEASQLDPSWQEHLRAGLEQEQQGDLAGARRELEAVLMSAPHDLTALRHLAELSRARGDDDDAFRRYTTIVYLVPSDIEATLQLGLLYEARGDAEAAEHQLRRAHALAPSRTDVDAALARIQVRARSDGALGTGRPRGQ